MIRAGLWGLGVALLGAALAAPVPKAPDYHRDVEDTFRAYCTSCHGEKRPKAGLQLHTYEAFLDSVEDTDLVVPGDSESSVLIQRLRGYGDKAQMPLGFKPLDEDRIAAIAAWIDAGAPAPTGERKPHWAYQPIEKPDVPGGAAQPIDAFIQQRLKQEGLDFSEAADPAVLMRRVSLDLTGLPPTPEEIDAFLADDSPDAYENLVDRLLASPHFGERMARPWLDLARYADTNGYEADAGRTAWLWRDWVIGAFNENKPFDEFTIEQIAGDMLSEPTVDQLIATGFHRNSMHNLEGGVDPYESHFEVVLDRVDTTSAVWLGQTMECARCHDHKFDPISQADYYKMAAFFDHADTEMRGSVELSSNKLWEPAIPVPSEEQIGQKAQLQSEIAQAEKLLGTETERQKSSRLAWMETMQDESHWRTPEIEISSAGGAEFKRMPDGSLKATGANPEDDTYVINIKADSFRAIRIEALPDKDLVNGGSGRSNSGNIVLSRFTVDHNRPKQYVADFIQANYNLAGLGDNNGDTGWALSPQQNQPHSLIGTLYKPQTEARVELVFASRWKQHSLGRFRITVSDEPWAIAQAAPKGIVSLARAESHTAEQEKQLIEAFAAVDPARAGQIGRLRAARSRLQVLASQIPTALIMRDKADVDNRTTAIRIRGEFGSKGTEVEAGPPSFAPIEGDWQQSRLGLAQWLVSPKNPLTPRVQVNRLWEMLFGRGLVATSENFGTQGDPPTHPELMDWLAATYVESGWDTKAMLKRMVMSRTYRQSSAATPVLLEKDPENILLARGSRSRMPAEMIRDTVLAASGTLSRKVGGPSVMPYQPDGVWNSPYSGAQWVQSQGEDARRRSLYTYWKRTAPHPGMMVMDATSREQCTVRRQTTNTPLQALALLNDKAYFEAAEALAGVMKEKGLAYGFRACTGRTPSSAESARLEALKASLTAQYSGKTEEAKKLGGKPEDAALTLVANVLLNLDETISKE